MSNSPTAATPSPVPPNQAGPGGAPPKPKASAAGRFFRGLLRWVTAIVLVFFLGFLATWYGKVRPQTVQIAQMQTRIFNLQKQLNGPQPQLEILQCLLDVSRAQVALAQGETGTVQQALSGTDARLAKLQAELPSDQYPTLQAARTRLGLVLGEASSNTMAARNDLEVLANLLSSLQVPTPSPN